MNIHCIGIGGIGVSALARYYLAHGDRVTGSDGARSEITDALKSAGAHVFLGAQSASHVPANVERVIYSPAVREDNPERARAEELKKARPALEIFSYPEALGELTKRYDTIAVSGTHGKSTTTAMLGILLTKAGLDPTVLVGTKLKEFGDSNCRIGTGKYLVIEADEHFASLLNYRPKMIVLTTIEADHLDYYKTLGNILKTFKKYISLLPKDGWLVYNQDDQNTLRILNAASKNARFSARPYTLAQKEAARLRATLRLCGEHNVANALAALTAARLLGVPDEKSLKALSEYKGAWRRFETFRVTAPAPYTLVSDYGHHPTEIKVTVEAARSKWPKKKIVLVFQPHQYERTRFLYKDFVNVLARLPVDTLILADIYDVAGRESASAKETVSSERLAQSVRDDAHRVVKTVLHIPTGKEIKAYLARTIRGGEIVIVMGAGDIYANLTLLLTNGPKKENMKKIKTNSQTV